MWHPFTEPEENIEPFRTLQPILGYLRYLLMMPILFDLFWSTIRYYNWDHNQDSYSEAWNRWVYYMGGVTLIFLTLLSFSILLQVFLGDLEQDWIILTVCSLATLLAWIVVDLVQSRL